MSTPAPELLTSHLEDDLTRSVLLTLLYADLFDHALTIEELWRYLVLRSARRDEVEAAVARAATALERHDGLVTWRGRARLVAERGRRRERSAEMWRQAERYAGWMRRAPWVRMVAVCGSLAMENPRASS